MTAGDPDRSSPSQVVSTLTKELRALTVWEKRALVAAALTLIAGLILELGASLGDAFARAGALAVVIGIVLVALDIPRQLREAADEYDEKLQERRQEIEIVLSDEEIARGVPGSIAYAVDKQLREALRRAAWTLAAILVAGTLAWGFGDMLQ